MMLKTPLAALIVAVALIAIHGAHASTHTSKGGDFVCTEQNSHCIYTNGNPGAYAVTYKYGNNPDDLVCDKVIDGRMAAPCRTTTKDRSVAIQVECRETDNYDGSRPYVVLAFGDDSHANLTCHNGSNGDKIWAGFQGSPNNKLLNGFYSYQYPHISAIVNCFSDNPYGP